MTKPTAAQREIAKAIVYTMRLNEKFEKQQAASGVYDLYTASAIVWARSQIKVAQRMMWDAQSAIQNDNQAEATRIWKEAHQFAKAILVEICK